VRDASLRSSACQVKDGSSGGLAAGSCCGGYGNQRQEFAIDRSPFSQRGIDKVHEVRFGVAGVEVHELRRVDDRSSSDGKECVRLVGLDPFYCCFDTVFRVSARLMEINQGVWGGTDE